MPIHLINGDALKVLSRLPSSSLVNCVITSPPYWGLRDYGILPRIWDGDPACEHEWGAHISVNATNHTTKARWNHTRNGRDELQPIEKRVSWLRTEVKQGQFCQHCGAWCGSLGLEPTYSLYVEHMVEVFREVRRVLREDGTLWLNLGDSYCSGGRATWRSGASENKGQDVLNDMPRPSQPEDLKPKDLIGLPWRVAFALQADGWYLRQDIIWHKPNPMPESIRDRCTKAHEYLFLLSKSARYYFDAEAIKEEAKYGKRIDPDDIPRTGRQAQSSGIWRNAGDGKEPVERGRNQRNATYEKDAGRNKRSVWTIATAPFPEAHFATFPPSLVEPCILAGCPQGGTVLDPFAGAGTVGLVASRLDRNAILVELSKPYCEMATRRLTSCSVSHYTLSP